MASTLTVEQLADAVARALGERLVAFLLYGSTARGTHVPQRSDVNTLLICDAVDERLFEVLAPTIRDWTRVGHPAPLIFTESEWRESATAFAIEYEEVREAHRLLAGKDPWQGITVRREDLRRQLEHELMGKLVRLRQAYGTLWSEPKRLGSVIVASAPGFFTMLRTVLRLSGEAVPVRPAQLLGAAAAVIGFSTDGLGPLVQHVEGGPALRLGRGDQLMPAYLAALARTAQYVTQLR
jgi:predicted nucleotidyltransferase